MEAQNRSSHKYVLLQVWCGLLTVAVVVMAAFFTTIRPKSAEDKVSVQRSDYVTPTANTFMTPSKLIGSSHAYMQLIKYSHNHSWHAEHRCESCSLDLRDNSILCKTSSIYFLYAQVTFSRHPKMKQAKDVVLIRNASFGRSPKKLVEGTFPHTTEGSVWVGKIISLTEGDSVSLEITGDFLTESTFWGAFQLH